MKYFCTFFLFFLLLFTTSSCTNIGTQAATSEMPPSGSDIIPTPEDFLFSVVKPDKTVIPFGVSDLKKLPLGKLETEGKIEEGPYIIDILNAAGINDYQEITISGSSGSVTLKKDDIGTTSLLDFTNHGTVKLSTLAIPKADWIKDVNLIEVK